MQSYLHLADDSSAGEALFQDGLRDNYTTEGGNGSKNPSRSTTLRLRKGGDNATANNPPRHQYSHWIMEAAAKSGQVVN